MRCYWAQAAEGTAALLKHILAFQPPRRTSVVLPEISQLGDVKSSSLRAAHLMGQLRPLGDGASSSSGELQASELLHEHCPAVC